MLPNQVDLKWGFSMGNTGLHGSPRSPFETVPIRGPFLLTSGPEFTLPKLTLPWETAVPGNEAISANHKQIEPFSKSRKDE